MVITHVLFNLFLSLSHKGIAFSSFLPFLLSASFDGELDGLDYTVYYYTVDIKGGYEFLKNNHYTGVFSLGYRHLYMDSKASQTDGSWFEENDRYAGPFMSVLIKFEDIIK